MINKDRMRTLLRTNRWRRALLWSSAATALLIAVASCGIEWMQASSQPQSQSPGQVQAQPPSHNTYIIRVERRNWPEQDRRELFDAWVGVARSMGYEPTLIVK